jgi:hypothetical protein
MGEVNKIRHLRNGDPNNGLIVPDFINKVGKFFARECLFDLLVAAPAFALRRQTRRWTP